MINDKSFLCLMLARGGSKGLPGKNLRQLHGRPLIDYTIDAVHKSKAFDRFILSTDSEEIADRARHLGVDTPFMRPAGLSGDDSSALDAIVHALKWVEAHDKKYDYVQYIFPTAPLRDSNDIQAGIQLLLDEEADMVISVCEDDHPKQWSNSLPPDGSLTDFIKKEYRNRNRQTLPKTYRINGAIYVAKWDVFYHKKDWFDQNTKAYFMPRERSVDIDTLLDFQMAEILLSDEVYYAA